MISLLFVLSYSRVERDLAGFRVDFFFFCNPRHITLQLQCMGVVRLRINSSELLLPITQNTSRMRRNQSKATTAGAF